MDFKVYSYKIKIFYHVLCECFNHFEDNNEDTLTLGL